MNLALQGGGVDVEVGAGQVRFGGGGQVRVCLCAAVRGGGGVVLLGDFRAVADFNDEFLLRVEEVGQQGLQRPDLVE